MSIKTYDDLQFVTHKQGISAEDIGHLELRETARQLDREGTPWELWLAGAYNSEGLSILWVPSSGRAGVAWGGGADWTDADSAQDALERYFGVDGKEMCS